MKYKISQDSEFTVVTEDGEFICSVVDDTMSLKTLISKREHLASNARRIVAALNSADWAAIHIQHTLENAQAAGLCN